MKLLRAAGSIAKFKKCQTDKYGQMVLKYVIKNEGKTI